MQTETIYNRHNTEKNAQRQSWSKPDLIDYGSVGDLTRGGDPNYTDGETNGYASAAP